MRLANIAGRLAVVSETGAADVERASGGRFTSDPQAVYGDWERFTAWAGSFPWEYQPYDEAQLDPPVPAPHQVFAVGLNYRAHAVESGLALPEKPTVFTKFPSCLTGPTGEVELVDGNVDWEAELVVVIGRRARRVAEQDAWSHVAGLTNGQDLSERIRQLAGSVPQFSLAKSHPGFGPIGPWVVTVDELPDPDDLAISCSLNGQVVQKSRTSDLVFSVPSLLARLSEVVTLYPGDLIFTGTPAGVGLGRSPQRYLAVGDVLETRIGGLGQMTHRFIAAGP